MQRQIHVFDNGVRVFDDHLIPIQRERYKKRNVHEFEEEDVFIDIIRSIPGNGCFVNIGAAIGYYSLLARKMAPDLKIYAIEPLERHRRFFKENILLNGFREIDFIIHKEGVSSLDGNGRFIDDGYGSSLYRGKSETKGLISSVKALLEKISIQIGIEKFDKKPKKITTIKTITLDHLMDIIKSSVDLLQMDVQGLEVDVLKGALHSLQTGNVKTFLIGTHGRAIHQECIDILREHGYVIECDKPDPEEQPDGIIVASNGLRRLKAYKDET